MRTSPIDVMPQSSELGFVEWDCRRRVHRSKTMTVVSWALLCSLTAGSAGAVPALTMGEGRAWAFSVREDVASVLSVRGLGVLAAGAALTAGALAIEDPIAQARTFDGYSELPDIGNAYGSWPVILGGAAGLAAAGRLTDRASLTTAGVDLGRSYVYSALVVVSMKLAFNRTRPDGESLSFPSGHAAGAFATAPVITHHFGPWAGVAAYALACATATGRMEDYKHYLSDVVFGAAVGFVIGDAVAGQRHRGSHLLLESDRVGLKVGF